MEVELYAMIAVLLFDRIYVTRGSAEGLSIMPRIRSGKLLGQRCVENTHRVFLQDTTCRMPSFTNHRVCTLGAR